MSQVQTTAIQSLKTTLYNQRQQIADMYFDGSERNAVAAMSNVARVCVDNPALLRCTPKSIIEAAREAWNLQLSIGGVMPTAALVPYGDEAKLIIQWQGLLEYAYRCGAITNHMTGIVYEKDAFEFSEGLTQKFYHSPTKGERGEITHVYAGFLLRNGIAKYFVWTKDEIEEHRKKYSKGSERKDSAWQTAWPKMAVKTVVRDAIQGRKFYIPNIGSLTAEIVDADDVRLVVKPQDELSPPVGDEQFEQPLDEDDTWAAAKSLETKEEVSEWEEAMLEGHAASSNVAIIKEAAAARRSDFE